MFGTSLFCQLSENDIVRKSAKKPINLLLTSVGAQLTPHGSAAKLAFKPITVVTALTHELNRSIHHLLCQAFVYHSWRRCVAKRIRACFFFFFFGLFFDSQLLQIYVLYTCRAGSFDGAQDFIGVEREAARGTLIDLRRVGRMAARQGAKAKIMEHHLRTREEWTLARVSGPHDDGDAGGGPRTSPKEGGNGGSAGAEQ